MVFSPSLCRWKGDKFFNIIKPGLFLALCQTLGGGGGGGGRLKLFFIVKHHWLLIWFVFQRTLSLANAYFHRSKEHTVPRTFAVIWSLDVTIHGLAPSYIVDLIYVKPLNTRYSLRSTKGLLLEHPKCKTYVTLGDRAFKAAAPTLWNELPIHFRNSKSFNSFKNLLKTHLFKLSFLD